MYYIQHMQIKFLLIKNTFFVDIYQEQWYYLHQQYYIVFIQSSWGNGLMTLRQPPYGKVPIPSDLFRQMKLVRKV